MPEDTTPPTGPEIVGAIPARWGSTRFPGKALHEIGGKPLVQHVWERCRECRRLDRVFVATDSERIAEAVVAFGGEAVMTSDRHPSGTDRIAEAARSTGLESATHFLNIQGDEPLIDPGLIDEMASRLAGDPGIGMITAANPMDPGDPALDDPNVVKVVLDQNRKALYFSRSPLPFQRSPQEDLACYRHKGIYGYRRDFLLQFVQWPPSPLERTEGLEQLRALEHGASIQVILTGDDSPGVDTPEQAAIIEQRIH